MGAASLLAKQNCLKNNFSKRIERTAGQNPTDRHRKLRSKKQILFHNQALDIILFSDKLPGLSIGRGQSNRSIASIAFLKKQND